MYASPRLKTTGLPQTEVLGIRPKMTADGADSQCQCADCDSDNCGPNNPCGIEPDGAGFPTILDVLRTQSA